jgi:4-amino-4-deoxy-L-arabinose transferase-like glycosyltransferase
VRSFADRIRTSTPWQVAIVIASVCAVQLPMITHAGFSSTEGHRVIPAWEMLDTGDVLVPHMFGRPYLRKPPGIAWAIASTGAILGESEFSARLVSVLASIAMGLLVLAMASRWFGKPWGLVAALAQILFPMYWPPGRSAEIEALNNLATMATVLPFIDLALASARDRRHHWWLALLMTAGAALMAATKGPAGLPALAGALIGVLIAGRAIRPILRLEIVGALAIAALLTGLYVYLLSGAIPGSDRLPTTQNVTEFLWGGEGTLAHRIGGVLLLPLKALLAGSPLTYAVLGPWVFARSFRDLFDDRALRLCRALALAWPASILALMSVGIDNHRYSMVSMVTLAPLAGATIAAASHAAATHASRIARFFFLDRPSVWLAGLLIGAAIYIPIFETGRARRSGKRAGIMLAAQLPDGARVVADHLVEARPEVLLYARRAAAADSRHVVVNWIDHHQARAELRPGDYAVIRTDDHSDESLVYRSLDMVLIATGQVHEYEFELRRMPAP